MSDEGDFLPDKPRRKWLYSNEEFWVDSQPFLLTQGYQLRPRYRPDWVPSWTVKKNFYHEYEDRLSIHMRRVLDATRMHDGKKVILKRIETDGDEISIIKHLDSVRADPRNRTIPILDIFAMPNSPWSFLVMPYCRRFNYPPFHCRTEFVEAMTQFLEGLQFMHEHNIVHFDIAPQNMLMDESRVVPLGSHFSHDRTHTGFFRLFSWNDRCTVGPVDYYYIDFGLSLYFPDGRDTALHLATLRTFPDIPELSQTVPYNPFNVDIFQLGLTMHKLINAYPDLEDFRPVAKDMTAADPNDRPNAAEALAQFRGILAELPASILSAQIWQRETGFWKKMSRLFLGGYKNDFAHLDKYK
ncbi:kinase-like domain-containing protein [Mycena maculata]|uniref:Kinase-like domain-containing protein n=1 Tax=Mycena maculata TaxID=230809 RepID=A0AAD7KGV4_9AGAR|nr:kinase-like domain-containing protein [Mycena maculata]